MSYAYPALGSAIAIAGADKLSGSRGYKGMFSELGWSRQQVEALAAAEVVGGALMIPRLTRRLGGALVAAVSAAVLISEIKHADPKLVAMRGLVMLAGVSAVLSTED